MRLRYRPCKIEMFMFMKACGKAKQQLVSYAAGADMLPGAFLVAEVSCGATLHAGSSCVECNSLVLSIM